MAKHLLLAAVAALMLLSALAVRRAGRPAEHIRATPVFAAPSDAEPPAAEEAFVPEAEEPPGTPGADALFQNLGVLAESAGSREDAVRVTAEFLGLDGGVKEAFERAVEEVLADWAALQHAMGQAFASFPEDLPDEDLERIQRETDEQFASRREALLCRLHVFTGERDLRGRLAEWVERLYASEMTQ